MALTSSALSDSELPDSVRHIVKCGVSFDKFFIVIWSFAGFSRIWPCLEHFFFFCALRSRGAFRWAPCSVLALSLGDRVYKQLYGSPRTSTGLAQDAWRWKGGIQVQSYSCQVMRTQNRWVKIGGKSDICTEKCQTFFHGRFSEELSAPSPPPPIQPTIDTVWHSNGALFHPSAVFYTHQYRATMLRPIGPALHSFSSAQCAVVALRNGNIRRCAKLGTLWENNSSPLPRFAHFQGSKIRKNAIHSP